MSPAAETLQLVALLPRLRRFARALARDSVEADDLVQVAVARALLQLDELPPGTPLESWVFGIVRNAWIDETCARRQHDQELASAESVADSSSAAPAPRLSIGAALERLPEEQRLAVALVLVEGMAYKEAAAVLDVPVGTVASRLARGRETLEALLGGREGGV